MLQVQVLNNVLADSSEDGNMFWSGAYFDPVNRNACMVPVELN